MTVPHVRYLHGFASGPQTGKGADLGQRLAGGCASYAIVDLEGGDFTAMTMESLRANTLAACPGDGPVILVGSSLGGYLAAWIAASRCLPRLAGIVLIAPAFGFTSRWADRLGAEAVARWRRDGSLPFFHYGQQRELPLGSDFLASCERLPESPGDPGVPCAIIHGRSDETVDHRVSLAFAAAHPAVELHLVQGDHRVNEPRHAELIAWTVADLCRRAA